MSFYEEWGVRFVTLLMKGFNLLEDKGLKEWLNENQ